MSAPKYELSKGQNVLLNIIMNLEKILSFIFRNTYDKENKTDQIATADAETQEISQRNI